jgi:hypothetical protein
MSYELFLLVLRVSLFLVVGLLMFKFFYGRTSYPTETDTEVWLFFNDTATTEIYTETIDQFKRTMQMGHMSNSTGHIAVVATVYVTHELLHSMLLTRREFLSCMKQAFIELAIEGEIYAHIEDGQITIKQSTEYNQAPPLEVFRLSWKAPQSWLEVEDDIHYIPYRAPERKATPRNICRYCGEKSIPLPLMYEGEVYQLYCPNCGGLR